MQIDTRNFEPKCGHCGSIVTNIHLSSLEGLGIGLICQYCNAYTLYECERNPSTVNMPCSPNDIDYCRNCESFHVCKLKYKHPNSWCGLHIPILKLEV